MIKWVANKSNIMGTYGTLYYYTVTNEKKRVHPINKEAKCHEMPFSLASLLVIQFFNQTTAKQIILYVNPLDDNKDMFWYWVCNLIRRLERVSFEPASSRGNYDLVVFTLFLGHVETSKHFMGSEWFTQKISELFL